MKEIVAATIAIGERHEVMAALAAKSLLKYTDIEVQILGQAHLDQSDVDHPSQLKFRLFDLLPNYERILYFDADMVFMQPLDLKRMVCGDSLLCVRDGASKPWVQHDAARIGVEAAEYFNSGFFVVSRDLHQEMLHIADSLTPLCRGGFNDQTQLNWACRLLDIKLEFIPLQYNDIEFFRRGGKDTIVGHFISHNIQQLEPLELDCLYHFWMDRDPAQKS